MITASAVKTIPAYVDLKSALAQFPEFFVRCENHIKALKEASNNAPMFIGGIDAYKLITKSYHPDFDAPLCYIVRSNLDWTTVLDNAIAIEPSIDRGFVVVGETKTLSNGDFKIDVDSGKVFHPFPKINPKDNLPKPIFIDSSEFIFDHIIKTPDLSTLILEANESAKNEQDTDNNQNIISLSLILACYHYWLRSGKVLSLDAATSILDLCRRDTIKYDKLLTALERIHGLVVTSTFDQHVLYLASCAQYVVDISNRATAPLVSENESLKNQIESLTKALESTIERAEQLKKSNDALHFENLLSSGANQLSVLLKADNESLLKSHSILRKQYELLFSEVVEMEKSLETAEKALEGKDQELKKTKEQLGEVISEYKELDELSDKLYAKGLRFEEKCKQQKEEIRKLNEHIVQSSAATKASTQEAIAKKDEIIADLKKQNLELKSGQATLSAKNHKLTQANTALTKALEAAPKAKPTPPPAQPILVETSPVVVPEALPPVVTEVLPPAVPDVVASTPPEQPIAQEKPIIKKASTEPFPSDKIKSALAVYVSNILSTPVGKPIAPFEIDTTTIAIVEADEYNRFVPLFPEGDMSIQKASEIAVTLRELFISIRAMKQVGYISLALAHLITTFDGHIDVLSCRRNTFKDTQTRIHELISLVQLFQQFLNLTANTEHLSHYNRLLLDFLTDQSEKAVNQRNLLVESLTRISTIFQYMFKQKKVIFDSAKMYGISSEYQQLVPGYLSKSGQLMSDQLAFLTTLRGLEYVNNEFDTAKSRLVHAAGTSDAKHTILTVTMFDSIFYALVAHHRLMRCSPMLRQFMAINNPTMTMAKNTYSDIIKDLTDLFPNKSAKEHVTMFFNLCTNFSDISENKKIRNGNPLLRVTSPIFDEKFLKGKMSEQSIDAQIKLAFADIKDHFPSTDESHLAHTLNDIILGYKNSLTRSNDIEHDKLNKVIKRIEAMPKPKKEYTAENYQQILALHFYFTLSKMEQPGTHVKSLPSFISESFRHLASLDTEDTQALLKEPAFIEMCAVFPKPTSLTNADDLSQTFFAIFDAFHKISALDEDKIKWAMLDLITHLDFQTRMDPKFDVIATPDQRFKFLVDDIIVSAHNFICAMNTLRQSLNIPSNDAVLNLISNAIILFNGELKQPCMQIVSLSGPLSYCLFQHKDTLLNAHNKLTSNSQPNAVLFNEQSEYAFHSHYAHLLNTHQITPEFKHKAHFTFVQWLTATSPPGGSPVMTLDELNTVINEIRKTIEPLPSSVGNPPAHDEIDPHALNKAVIIFLINLIKKIKDSPEEVDTPNFSDYMNSLESSVSSFTEESIASLEALSKHRFLTKSNADSHACLALTAASVIAALNQLKAENKNTFNNTLVASLFMISHNLQLSDTTLPNPLSTAQSFQLARSLFTQVRDFLHDPILKALCDPDYLAEISNVVAINQSESKGLLHDPATSRQLFATFVQACGIINFLISKKDVIYAAHLMLSTQQKVLHEHILFYSEYEQLAAGSEAMSIAETYFLVHFTEREMQSPITLSEWSSLKNHLNSGLEAAIASGLLPDPSKQHTTKRLTFTTSLPETGQSSKAGAGINPK